jgi:hypothetical protein
MPLYQTVYDVQNLVLQLRRIRRRIRALLSSTSQMPPENATLLSVSSYSAGSALDLASASQQLEAFGKGLSSDMVSLYWAHSRHDAALAVLAKIADGAIKEAVRNGLSPLLFRPHWLSISALEDVVPVLYRLRALSSYIRPLGHGHEDLVALYIKPLLQGGAGALGVLYGLQTILPPIGQKSHMSSLQIDTKKAFIPLLSSIVLIWLKDEIKYGVNHPQFWTLTGWRKHPEEVDTFFDTYNEEGDDNDIQQQKQDDADSKRRNKSLRIPLIDLIGGDTVSSASATLTSQTENSENNATSEIRLLLSQFFTTELEKYTIETKEKEKVEEDEEKNKTYLVESRHCDLLSEEIEQFQPPKKGWGRHFLIVYLEGKLRSLYTITNKALFNYKQNKMKHDDDSSLSLFSNQLLATAVVEKELFKHFDGINKKRKNREDEGEVEGKTAIESLSWAVRPLLDAYLETVDEICDSRKVNVAQKLIDEKSALISDYRSRIRKLILFMSLPFFYSAKEALDQLFSSQSGKYMLEERSLLLRLLGSHAEAMELLVHQLCDHIGAETYCRLAVEQSDAHEEKKQQLKLKNQPHSHSHLYEETNNGLGGKISEAFTDLLKAYVSKKKEKTFSILKDRDLSIEKQESVNAIQQHGEFVTGRTDMLLKNLLKPHRHIEKTIYSINSRIAQVNDIQEIFTTVPILDQKQTSFSVEKVTLTNDSIHDSSTTSTTTTSLSSSSSREGLEAVVGILARNTSKVRTSTALQLLPYSFPLSQAEPFLLACMRQTSDSAKTLAAARSLAAVTSKQKSIGLVSRQARAIVIEKGSLCAECGRKFATSNSRTMTSTIAGAIAVYPDGRVVHSACLESL